MKITISCGLSRPQVSFTKSDISISHNLLTFSLHLLSLALLNGPAALGMYCEVITTVIPLLLTDSCQGVSRAKWDAVNSEWDATALRTS